MRMKRFVAIGWLAVVAPLLGNGPAAVPGPEQTVQRYLQAMQSGDFATAYTLLTEHMTRGRDAWSWAAEQKQIYQRAGVEVLGFQVYRGRVDGDTAVVPNVLRARDDVINRTGEPEYELYTLRRIGGYWKIDRQRLMSRKERQRWLTEPWP